MTPKEVIAQANASQGPVLIFAQSAQSAQDIAMQVEPLASVLYKGMGMDNVESEIQRFRTGEVDIIVCDKAYMIGVNLCRDDRQYVQVLWCYAPSPEQKAQGEGRVNWFPLTEPNS
ncbi:MAG TPA: helicase-related protein [Candidatus Paceibacterota bacterium]